MKNPLILASGSKIRTELLSSAGITHSVHVARIDEDSVRGALEAEQAKPRDVADTLAELKARKISQKNPGAFVLGCDQILQIDDRILSKPETIEQAKEQLTFLSGKKHMLLSAAVLYQDGEPKWRHIGMVRLYMRELSDGFIDDYLGRNWPSVADSVGAYKLEEEGVRLFTRIEGDHFNVLGLPLIEFINHLTLIGELAS
ncbi:septum formation protein [Thalassococcus halodurans]|uniref:Nucleoside triphosphate pyrophosphatase n=1 Tax=Thalassococcus halodurans TaxID=373675 RepID=A0A1H5ZA14_9RHOB|nr:Maf family nucleotide pyrophosphatase [Thalassococcus halodurans]SEG32565.1 septum formation protein [Thalassococcus halodurans]